MNKKLLAIAVGAAITLPSVALAAGPTVYGKVNLTLEKQDLESKDVDQISLDSNNSRLGVKGDFDLDVGGLKAIYQAEFGMFVDDGDNSSTKTLTDSNGDTVDVKDNTGVFSQRNIFGGITGGFGTVKAGMFDSPTKMAQGKIDQFNDLDGDIKKILAGENRVKNIVQYSTPKFADSITVNVAIIPGEGATVDGEVKDGFADSTSISAVFESGNFYAALAHDSEIVDGLEVDDQGASAAADITRLVGAFKAEAFEVGLLYQIAEESEGDGKDSSIVASGAFNIDRIKLKAQYGMTDGDVSDDTWTTTSVGADYKLAKASKVFAYYTILDKDVADTSDSYFAVGMEHKF